MTMFDKVVATDLAALGEDSRQRVKPIAMLMPRPTPVVAMTPSVPNPARRFANRAASVAAGIAAIGIGVALALVPHRPMFVVRDVDAPWMPSVTTNIWFQGFAAVVIIATTYLVAHRLASRSRVRQSPDLAAWRRRARGVGDAVFSATSIACVAIWFAMLWDRNTTWTLRFGHHYVDAWQWVGYDERTNPVLAIAGSLAVALVARCIAVSLVHRSSDRWRGSSPTVVLKITAITVLASVFGLCVFDGNGVRAWGWQLLNVHSMSPAVSLHNAVFGVLDSSVRYYQDPLSESQWAALQLVIAMTGLAVLVALACAFERYRKHPLRILHAIEHAVVIPLASAVAVTSLLRLGWSESDQGIVYPPLATSIALVIILVSATLRRRRDQLT